MTTFSCNSNDLSLFFSSSSADRHHTLSPTTTHTPRLLVFLLLCGGNPWSSLSVKIVNEIRKPRYPNVKSRLLNVTHWTRFCLSELQFYYKIGTKASQHTAQAFKKKSRSIIQMQDMINLRKYCKLGSKRDQFLGGSSPRKQNKPLIYLVSCFGISQQQQKQIYMKISLLFSLAQRALQFMWIT